MKANIVCIQKYPTFYGKDTDNKQISAWFIIYYYYFIIEIILNYFLQPTYIISSTVLACCNVIFRY